MNSKLFKSSELEKQWCPGCGNFAILSILIDVLNELGLSPQKTAIVSGIGQAAKTPHHLNVHTFHSLHGRALSIATGLKISNPELTVIAEGGDGDMYGEGGNHFIHTIRRNPNITNIVHNNMIYGLTKGQASPTSSKGLKTKIQREGVHSEPFNPIATAITLGATFVARAFAGHQKETKEILKQAIAHKGYALIDIFQPCVVFNKVNTYQWFNDHVFYLDKNHDTSDRMQSLSRAFNTESLALGIFYKKDGLPTFENLSSAYRDDNRPFHKRF